ncbi:uncharacterized protein [Triticum aestivum]|uniref:uncharacterized protein n=1 Tax=Triticum aestivum TaxID=4565 RepID=UPI001D01AB19|nr:uncharacterized protein LOC123142364 [Triticum aestivum]
MARRCAVRIIPARRTRSKREAAIRSYIAAPKPRLVGCPTAPNLPGSLSTIRRIPYCLSQRRRRPSLPLQVEELLFQFVHDPYGAVGDVALRELVSCSSRMNWIRYWKWYCHISWHLLSLQHGT